MVDLFLFFPAVLNTSVFFAPQCHFGKLIPWSLLILTEREFLKTLPSKFPYSKIFLLSYENSYSTWSYIVMDILALRQWRDENVFEL